MQGIRYALVALTSILAFAAVSPLAAQPKLLTHSAVKAPNRSIPMLQVWTR
jgi:hypothetical protein